MSALFIFSHGPHGDAFAWESLDVALTTAAFDIPTHVVFSGEGIVQLLKPRSEAPLTNPHRQAQDLVLYGIDTLYYIDSDLARYQLSDTQLLESSVALTAAELRAMIARASSVQSF